MRLTTGQAAPDFSVKDSTGNVVSLSDFKGKHVLVSFFRYAGCPFCNLTLVKLIERYDNFAARGLETIVFFQSGDESIDRYVTVKKPPFPIIADPKKQVYDKYAVESSKIGAVRSLVSAPGVALSIASGKSSQGKIDGDGFLMPAQFIIGPDGVILKAHYGTNFADKMPLFDIEQVIMTKVTNTKLAV